MSHNIICPACEQEIPRSRVFNDCVVCQCGWNHSIKRSNIKQQSKHQMIAGSIILAAVLFVVAFHTLHWKEFSLKVIPLKAKHIIGQSTPNDLHALIDICKKVGHLLCQEEIHSELYKKHHDLEALVELGDIHFKTDRFDESISTLTRYFEKGGKNLMARFHMARSLGKLGKHKESEFHFRKILKARPDVVQITVVRTYIQMLIDNKQLNKAKNVIAHYKSTNRQTYGHLAVEEQHLNNRLRSIASVKK